MRWLWPLLLLALILRFYHLAYPLGDLHSWRQADTAAVARSLKSYGGALWLPICQKELSHIGVQGEECRVPLLNPQFDSFVTIDGKATWMDGRKHTNDTRNHFAEFPLYQGLVAQLAIWMESFPVLSNGVKNVSLWVDSVPILVDPPANRTRWEEVKYQMAQTASVPVDEIVLSGRIISILASMGTMVFIYLLVTKYFMERVGLMAAAVYGFLPYSVFWSRTVLPDSLMVMSCLGALYFLHKALNDSKSKFFNLTLFCIFGAIALLLKVFFLFLALPILLVLWFRWGKDLWHQKSIYLMLLTVLLPFVLWRFWIQLDPLRLAGIPASDWLFNGSGVRLKPAWWYWLFQTRLDHYMFNFVGLSLFAIGAFFYNEVVRIFGVNGSLHKVQNLRHSISVGRVKIAEFGSRYWFWTMSLIACLSYLVVFATGNVQHEYYQLPLVPFMSVFVALGFWYVWQLHEDWIKWIQRGALIGMIGLMWVLGMYKVKDWYGPQMPSYVYAGLRANAVLDKQAFVIADFGGDTTMLYYANRPGWSIVEFSFEELRQKGATAYLSAFRSDGVNDLAKKYRVIEETKEYVILDLTTLQ